MINKINKINKLLWLLPLFIFLAFVILLMFRLGKNTQIVPEKILNRPMPAFVLPDLIHPETNLTPADLPKKPYVLNVWGSWCPTCQLEHPLLMQLAKQGQPQGQSQLKQKQPVTLVGINYKDELGDALNYLQQYGNPYVFNIQDYQGELALELGLTGAPESFVIDANGHIRQHIVGAITNQSWQTRVLPCLQALQLKNSDVIRVCQ